MTSDRDEEWDTTFLPAKIQGQGRETYNLENRAAPYSVDIYLIYRALDRIAQYKVLVLRSRVALEILFE